MQWEDVVKQSNHVYNFDPSSSTEQTDMDDGAIPYSKFSNSMEKPLPEVYGDRLLGGVQFGGIVDDQTYNPYDADGPLLDEQAKFYPGTNLLMCKVDGLDRTACPRYETCEPLVPSTAQGVCNCLPGYRRQQGSCQKSIFANDDDIAGDGDRRKLTLDDDMSIYDGKSESAETPGSAAAAAAAPPIPSPIQKLSVSVISKDVQLPEKEVTLAAYTVPDEKTAGVPYEYSWSLISQPPGGVNGTMSDQTKDKIKLSNLSEGLYQFKVVVNGKGLKGEAFGNVTVLPEKRINKAPTVIITPRTQIVKWPTSGAILDGSSSKVRVNKGICTSVLLVSNTTAFIGCGCSQNDVSEKVKNENFRIFRMTMELNRGIGI